MQQPKQNEPGSQDSNAHQLRGRRPASEKMLIGRIIAAEYLHKRAQNRVAHQISRKHLPIEFLSPVQPRQSQIQTKAQKRFINLCRMNWRRELSNWMCIMAFGKTNRPTQAACSSITTSIHQTADPPKHITQRDARSQNVRQFPKIQFPDPRVQDARQTRPNEAALIDESAFLDHEDLPNRFSGKLFLPKRDYV